MPDIVYNDIPDYAVFNSYSARLVRVEDKLYSIGDNGMSIGDAAIFGVLLAVIVAVTWKG